jgi:hypothetical protein
MADKTKDLWLKVLLGFIFSLIVLTSTMGAKSLDRKLNKDVFERHEEYQNTQFSDIKDSLIRIEKKL